MENRRCGLLYSVGVTLFIASVAGEFLVNVKTKAGNVVKQSIRENITESFIVLKYTDWDLTEVTQVVDFQSSLNIFRVVMYGEIELGQPPARILCFINYLSVADFIEPDAVSKLRQVSKSRIIVLK